MRLIPSFFQSTPEPVTSTYILESSVNGNCKKYTINQTESGKIDVTADIYGRRKVVTLTSREAAKVNECLKALSVSGSPFFTFKPMPPMLYPNSLEGLARYRKELDRYEEELKKYESERTQQPNKRKYYLEQRTELLKFLDTKFIGPAASSPVAAPAA